MNCNSNLLPLRSVDMKDSKEVVAGGRMMTKVYRIFFGGVAILKHVCMLKRIWAHVEIRGEIPWRE